jgi:hypothetical protein
LAHDSRYAEVLAKVVEEEPAGEAI